MLNQGSKCVRAPCGVLVVLLLNGLAGCTALPVEQGYQDANALLEARIGIAPTWSDDNTKAPDPPQLPTTPIDPEQAVKLAFLHSPRVAESYSRIGLSLADLEAARRLVNPGLGFSYLDSSGGGEQVSRSLTLSLTDVVLRPVRKRYATAALQQMQLQVASELQALGTEVETGWYNAVAAEQISTTRALIAQAATQSAVLAQRFFDAGNINRLQLAQEQAAAANADIESLHAQAQALRARADLATLLGLPVESPWTTSGLPALPDSDAADPDSLVRLATEQRLDLAAARQQMDLHEDALVMARRWRWLGRFEVGYERESEAEGGVIRGPTFAIELPFFNQGQDVIARAEAQRAEAEARFDRIRLEVRNNVQAAVQGMQLAREVAERYQDALVPAREEVVARTQEEVNFMLAGVFELILAKQAGYDAWQGYLESLRDYWIEHTRLRAAVGGALPVQHGPASPVTPRPASEDHSHSHGDKQ
jgi:outer membrane protein, heavy metal efflux system